MIRIPKFEHQYELHKAPVIFAGHELFQAFSWPKKMNPKSWKYQHEVIQGGPPRGRGRADINGVTRGLYKWAL